MNKAIDNVFVSKPEKILFKKANLTKEDIFLYYKKISSHMIPYIKNRILSTVRCPDGIESSCFFKRHPSREEGVKIINVKDVVGNEKKYYYITDEYGLLSEVKMYALEFHTWGSKITNLEKPDIMIFDLDPGEGINLTEIRRGVKDLKSILDNFNLVSYLKTSGGKGYHIVVPFKPSVNWNTFHNFSKNIAMTMEAKWPDLYTSNVRKKNRVSRIFIDYIRNSKAATSVAPYSIRAREKAAVSMPISWGELDKIAPQDIKIEDVLKRINRKDPWNDFFQNKQVLKDI